MFWILAAWALPLITFWGWYFLSAFNLHFGYVLLTRQAHELVFQIYGETLGIDPAVLPGLVARACVLDTMLLLAILGVPSTRQDSRVAEWPAQPLFRLAVAPPRWFRETRQPPRSARSLSSTP